MAMEHKSRTVKLTVNYSNDAGKTETESISYKGIDPEATESMMTNFCEGIEEVSSDTVVSRKYVDVYQLSGNAE